MFFSAKSFPLNYVPQGTIDLGCKVTNLVRSLRLIGFPWGLRTVSSYIFKNSQTSLQEHRK